MKIQSNYKFGIQLERRDIILWDKVFIEKDACILVFDLTILDSFEYVENWRNEFLSSLNPLDASSYPFILVGNKNDMKEIYSSK